jgi:hypothetical protein
LNAGCSFFPQPDMTIMAPASNVSPEFLYFFLDICMSGLFDLIRIDEILCMNAPSRLLVNNALHQLSIGFDKARNPM